MEYVRCVCGVGGEGVEWMRSLEVGLYKSCDNRESVR